MGLQGIPISGTAPSTNNILQYNGTQWIPINPNTLSTNNIYNSDGTLTGTRTVTMGADTLTFTSTTGNFNFTTTGSGSVAMGKGVSATGTNSTAMGYGTPASGNNSTAMGNGTHASGSNGTAMGYQTTASGTHSTAMGQKTNAKSYDETAIGAFNTTYSPTSATSWVPTDRLFGIGNGTSSIATSDAMVVLKNGNVGIGTAAPTDLLSVNGTANNSTGTWGVFSDARIKTVHGDFTDGLNVIRQIHPVRFRYNANAPFRADGEQIGVVAQELEKIAPYMVSQKEYKDIKDLREVSNQAYVFLLINGMQEQQKQIDELKKEIEELKKK